MVRVQLDAGRHAARDICALYQTGAGSEGEEAGAFVPVGSIALLYLQLPGLTPELTMLALSMILGLAQLLLAARANNGQRGLRWNLGPRDGEPPPVNNIAARLERARRNFMETFPFFLGAVMLSHVTGRHGWPTVLGADAYFWGRLLYLPLYAFGVPALRTLAWLIATLGLVSVLVGALGYWV